jgi:hypothetical protein
VKKRGTRVWVVLTDAYEGSPGVTLVRATRREMEAHARLVAESQLYDTFEWFAAPRPLSARAADRELRREIESQRP